MSTASQASLQMTLPAGWRRLHVDALLGALSDESSSAVAEEVYGPGSGEELVAALGSLRETFEEGNVLLMALRFRPDERTLDVLTVSMPHASAVPTEQVPSTSDSDPLSRSVVDAESGVLYESDDQSGSSGLFRTRTHAIALLRPTERAALVTLSSTRAGVADALAREAAEVAASLHLEGNSAALGDIGLTEAESV